MSLNLRGWWNSNQNLDFVLEKDPEVKFVMLQECFKGTPPERYSNGQMIWNSTWRMWTDDSGRTSVLCKNELLPRLVENTNMEDWETMKAAWTIIECKPHWTRDIRKMRVVSMYRSPEQTPNQMKMMLDKLDETLGYLRRDNIFTLVGMDTNLKSCQWGSKWTEDWADKLCDKMMNNGLVTPKQADNEPTFESERGSSRIDAIFCTVGLEHLIGPIRTGLNLIHTADHNPLMIDIHTLGVGQPRECKWRRDYGKCKWHSVEAKLKSDLPQWRRKANFETTEGLDGAVKELTNICKVALEENTPRYKVRGRSQYWWTATLEKMYTELRRLKQRTRRNPYEEGVRMEFKKIRSIFQRELRKRKKEVWKAKLDKFAHATHENIFQYYHRILPKSPFKMPAITHYDGAELTEPAISNDVKAAVLANKFASVYARAEPPGVDFSRQQVSEHNERMKERIKHTRKKAEWKSWISRSQTRRMIRELKSNKAPGYDGIPTIFYKKMIEQITCPLTTIFNASINLAHYPEPWKNTIIVPIAKPNKDPTDAASYRPISLLPIGAKILDKWVDSTLRHFDDQWLSPTQVGFRANHSSEELVHAIIEDAHYSRHQKGITCLVQIDEKRAYDTVWTDALMMKMDNLTPKPPVWVVPWLWSCITKRRVRVRVEEALSEAFIQPDGLPQGLSLSPRLYNYFTSDLTREIKNPATVAQFADDISLWVSGWPAKSEESVRWVQESVNRSIKTIHRWNKSWGQEIDPKKSSYIIIKSPWLHCDLEKFEVRVAKKEIKRVECIRVLGFYIDRHLSLKQHCEHITTKFRRMCGFLSYVIGEIGEIQHVKAMTLFKEISYTLLEYCGALYSTTPVSHIRKIEQSLKTFARRLCGISKVASVDDAMLIVGIPPLSWKLDYLAVKLFTRIVTEIKITGSTNNLRKRAWRAWSNYAFDWTTQDEREHHRFGIRNRSPLSKGYQLWITNKSTLPSNFHWKEINQVRSTIRNLRNKYAPSMEKIWFHPKPMTIIYTDGSSDPNPGPSGFGVAIVDGYTGVRIEKRGYIGPYHTNIQSEIRAIMEAAQCIRMLPKCRPRNIYCVSDCRMVLNALCGLNSPKKYKEEFEECAKTWESLISNKELVKDVWLVWVKGHSISEGNRRADQLARIGRLEGCPKRNYDKQSKNINTGTKEAAKIAGVLEHELMKWEQRWKIDYSGWSGATTLYSLRQIASFKEWWIVWYYAVQKLEKEMRKLWWQMALPSSGFYDENHPMGTFTQRRCVCGEKRITLRHGIESCSINEERRKQWIKLFKYKDINRLKDRELRRMIVLGEEQDKGQHTDNKRGYEWKKRIILAIRLIHQYKKANARRNND